MGKITDILSQISHRPSGLPEGKWKYYQEWNHVLFFHWVIPAEIIKPLIPKNLELDLFDGKAYVSLVPFTMQKIRPRYLPALSAVSDFHEINLRTYVIRDGKPGVYFINIESQKRFSAFISRKLSGLPYEKSLIKREMGRYTSSNPLRKFSLETEFEIAETIENKSDIEKWLTERYALFLEEKGKLFRYDIHHKEWKIKSIAVKKLKLDYKLQGLNLADKQPDLIHYSDGVEVIAWKRLAV